MEKAVASENLWRVWVDTSRRIVSFHEEEGCKLLEFRSRELFPQLRGPIYGNAVSLSISGAVTDRPCFVGTAPFGASLIDFQKILYKR